MVPINLNGWLKIILLFVGQTAYTYVFFDKMYKIIITAEIKKLITHL